MARINRFLLCLALSLLLTFMASIIRIPEVKANGLYFDYDFLDEVQFRPVTSWDNSTEFYQHGNTWYRWTWGAVSSFLVNMTYYDYTGEIYGYKHQFDLKVTQMAYENTLLFEEYDTVNYEDVGIFYTRVSETEYRLGHEFGNSLFFTNYTGKMLVNEWYRVERLCFFNDSSNTIIQRNIVTGLSVSHSSSGTHGLVDAGYDWEGNLNHTLLGTGNIYYYVKNQKMWLVREKINVTITAKLHVDNSSISVPIEWEGSPHSTPYSKIVWPDYYQVEAPRLWQFNDTHNYLFLNWSDGSTGRIILQEYTEDTTLLAYYSLQHKWDPGGFVNFWIGFLGLAMMFSSWIFLKIKWSDKQYGEAIGIWLILNIVGLGIFTVLLGG